MPRHIKRTKLRPKDLRGPDEFETLTARALAWASERRTLVLSVAGGLAAVALCVLGFTRVSAARAAAAADAFRSTYARFQAGQFAEATAGFAGVAGEYPHTPFGRLARLYRAHALARQNDAAGAATAYGEYLSTSPDSYFRQEALVGLAHAREATADTTGALEAYAEAGAIEGPFQRDALLGAARLHEAAGNTAAAQEIYSRLLKGSPDPQLRAFLLAKLPPGSQPPENPPDVAAAKP